jgi:hypothetical protein
MQPPGTHAKWRSSERAKGTVKLDAALSYAPSELVYGCDGDLARWARLFPFAPLAHRQRRDAAATMADTAESCGEFFGLNPSG